MQYVAAKYMKIVSEFFEIYYVELIFIFSLLLSAYSSFIFTKYFVRDRKTNIIGIILTFSVFLLFDYFYYNAVANGKLSNIAFNIESISINSKEIDKKINNLKEGVIIFESPKTMFKNKTYLVDLKIVSLEKIQYIFSQLQEFKQWSTKIKYSNSMEVSLIGGDKKSFEIVSITPKNQAVQNFHDTIWKWYVTPRQSGIHSYHLVISVNIDNYLKYTITTVNNKIKIKVDYKNEVIDFFYKNVKWLLATIIIPLLIYLWRLIERKEIS